MWVQGIKVRILLLTLRLSIQKLNKFWTYLTSLLFNIASIQTESFYLLYRASFRNFFKESFLFDYLYKSTLQRFVTVWIYSGSLRFNFTYINAQLNKFVFNNILERILLSTTRLKISDFNALFYTIFQIILFIVSLSGVIVVSSFLI